MSFPASASRAKAIIGNRPYNGTVDFRKIIPANVYNQIKDILSRGKYKTAEVKLRCSSSNPAGR